MWLNDFFSYIQYIFLFYFLIVNGVYIFLGIAASLVLKPYIQAKKSHLLSHRYTGLEPPITIIVPAYNEEQNIVSSIQSLLQTYYPVYEIIVVNDGSIDLTLARLTEAFELFAFPYAYCDRLETQKVKQIYQSKLYPQLRVIDKCKGGKADALRAGINLAKYPLFCGVDADSILQIESLWYLVQPFVDSQATVAAGGIIRIANGCTIEKGYLTSAKLPENPLALLQVVEYLRGFFLGRLGWSAINSMLIISGAFGLFHRQTVLNINGYNTKTVGEDMELVVHLHRHLIERKKPYKIVFVPDAVCWTECPEDLRTLRNQRIRWQRGLCESLSINQQLLFHPRSGVTGWFAFPFMLFSEVVGVFIGVIGYFWLVVGYYFGLVSPASIQAFLLIELGLGMLISLNGLFLEEIVFHVYPKFRHLLLLFLVAILENFGWRQLMNIWRLVGTIHWLVRSEAKWGNMKRRRSKIPVGLDRNKSSS
jgi:cellulose synthase/poly-beta-1,6-N-acetylglucosamine synthase-like glycosyltransferase